MEGGERPYQSYYGEYDWLDPELTRNTRGQYIPILPAEIVMLTLPGLAISE